LLSEDWRLEIMKTLDRPETFFQQILKKDAMLLASGFATVSQIANNYC